MELVIKVYFRDGGSREFKAHGKPEAMEAIRIIQKCFEGCYWFIGQKNYLPRIAS